MGPSITFSESAALVFLCPLTPTCLRGQGQGRSTYQLGVEDDGTCLGVSESVLADSESELRSMALACGAEVTVIERVPCSNAEGEARWRSTVAVKLLNLAKQDATRVPPRSPELVPAQSSIGAALPSPLADASAGDEAGDAVDMLSQETRVAVCGNVDAGKSTCVGVLVKHKLDDGRGGVRSLVMKYPHEVDSGRTSAVVQHTIFEAANGGGRRVTLVDLAGHEKYLRTTIYGFNSGLVDVALVLVNARKGPLGTTRHHLELAANLHIPVIVAVSKVDGCPPDVLSETGRSLAKLLKSLFPQSTLKPLRRLAARSAEEGESSSAGADGPAAAEALNGPSTAKLEELGHSMPAVIPIFPVSFVTGEGVERLRRFLFALSGRNNFARYADDPLEFVADDLFTPPGVGPVLSGFVLRGTVRAGQTVLVGPRPDGSFMPGTVRSIHRDRTLCPDASAGSAACLALALPKDQRRLLRRGMAVLSTSAEEVVGQWEFEARLFVVRGSSATLRIGYQPYCHIVMVRQSVQIVSVRVETRRRKKKKSGVSGEGASAAVGEGPGGSSESTSDDDDDSGGPGAESSDKHAVPSQEEIEKSEDPGSQVMHSGEMGVIRFRFLRRPEYVRPGMRVMLREGKMRSVGEVVA